MKTSIIKAKPCWHCGHLIDLQSDDFKRIDTLKTIVLKKEKVYVHTICETRALAQYAKDDAISDAMTDRDDDMVYDDSVLYYEVLNGDY